MVKMNASYFIGRKAKSAGEPAAWRHREPEEAQAAGPSLTIALAREPGAPASEVAREVGARLGWPVYDREFVQQVARDLGVPATHLEEVDERARGWLLECIEGLGNGPVVSELSYVRRLVRLIQALAARGRCVIVGRGASQFLPPETTLRVSLVGDLDDRVAALSRRLRLDRKEAAHKVETVRQERARFVREHFHKDPAKPSNYDLVVNTSHWSPGACAALVEQALHSKAAAAGHAAALRASPA